MPRESSTVTTKVVSRARGLDQYLKRIENLRTQELLSDKDAERAYTGGFLEFHAFLERTIETLFLGLLQGRLKSSDTTVRPRIAVLSSTVAADVVAGERSYVNWLPYEHHTLQRAKSFFRGGRPFDRLDKSDLGALSDNLVIRNALAHQSSAALRKFSKRIVSNKNLPPKQQRPAGYLRGSHTKGQTRMSFHLAQAVAIIRKLAD